MPTPNHLLAMQTMTFARLDRVPSALLAFVVAAMLAGCAGTEAIRGEFVYDLRPKDQRTAAYLPALPATPRYAYVGELTGQPNFDDEAEKKRVSVTSVFKWIVGLFDKDTVLRLQRPQHGVVGPNGRVYVVDAALSGVMVFDPNPPQGDKSTERGGHLQLWQDADAKIRFAGPVAVAIAWNGEIVVSDALLGAVLRLNDKGEPLGKIGVGELQRPTGIAFDREAGLLYVADTVAQNIKVYDERGSLVRSIGGPGEGVDGLNAPTHLAFANGKLYVSDTLNARIQIFDTLGRRIGGFGERGLFVGNLTRPKGVAVGAGGIVYVIESYFNHLLVYDEQGQLLLGINGSGLKEDSFLLPSGVWTDEKGRLFVADMFNARVVVFQFLGAH
jgi:DNA-binding beta-propeller fold protein YncE